MKGLINNAIVEDKTITIKYQKYDGTLSNRVISNITYSAEYGDDYIEAYCHLRHEKRTFKISRIISITDAVGNSMNSTCNQGYTRDYSYGKPINQSCRSSVGRNQNTSEGCYIATMAYGDYNHPQVLTLRRFRDDVLLKNKFGRLSVKMYYFLSPKLVYLLKDFKAVNVFIRKILDRICYVLIQKEK